MMPGPPAKPSLRPTVLGVELDGEARCVHYHSALDVVAIRMRCCRTYYACKDCHGALADHDVAVWPPDQWDEPAVLCGVCGVEMTVRAYLGCGDACPACQARFNPGCRHHHHLYFQMESQHGRG